jgi:hypothetical protein
MINPTRAGVFAGWTLDFRAGKADGEELLLLDSSDYYSTIDASMPGGLEGGSYTIVLEGILSEDFAALYARKSELVLNLHLYWRDDGIAGAFVDLAGLTETLSGGKPPPDSRVACLQVTALRRRAGARRYELVIEARELVFSRLLGRLKKTEPVPDLLAALTTIGEQIKGFELLIPPPTEVKPEDPDAGKRARSWEEGDKALDRLRLLGAQLERDYGLYGAGMYLIREDKLYAGPGRMRLVTADDSLGPDEGLVEIQETGVEEEDPAFVPQGPEDKPKTRALFELLLRGRPDLRPGMIVVFPRPPDTDRAGRLVDFSIDAQPVTGLETVSLYLRGVTHHLSREKGFVTTVRGFTVPGFPASPDRDQVWYRRSIPPAPEVDADSKSDGTKESEIVQEINKRAQKLSGKRAAIAEVRGPNVGRDQRPAQSERIRRSALRGDGGRHASVRLDVDPQRNTVFDDAPYATPFAFGKFGLILPRYPGSRVLVVHRDGDEDDPIDVGALWKRGDAPASNPGDWWLTLPAELAPDARGHIPDDATADEPTGKASNDLIDADGNRVIEVGKLRVRVGKGLMGDAGARPDGEAAPAGVSIEHESGSMITIDQDGNVAVKSAKKLALIAGEDVTIESPANVIMKVGGFVDVKKRT